MFANSALTLRSTAAEGWSNTGFMQSNFGTTSGEGYGLYSATASLDAKQGAGICIVLLPANNTWPGAEIDLLESSDVNRTTGLATVHWKGTGDTNRYTATSFTIDLTEKHVYSVDWERGSLTYYIDGKEIFQDTSHVPLDAADGGVNESLGAEVTAAKYGAVSSVVDLNLYDMSYPTRNSTMTATTSSSSTAMRFITSTGSTVAIASGEFLTDRGHGNTLTLPASGTATLAGNILSETLDLRAAMTASGWDHQMSDITKYLGEGKTTLATLEGHSLFT